MFANGQLRKRKTWTAQNSKLGGLGMVGDSTGKFRASYIFIE